jgi:hypothetical protein
LVRSFFHDHETNDFLLKEGKALELSSDPQKKLLFFECILSLSARRLWVDAKTCQTTSLSAPQGIIVVASYDDY